MKESAEVHIEQVTETTLMINLPQPPSPALTHRLLAIEQTLYHHYEAAIVDTVLSYNSLMATVNPAILAINNLMAAVPEHLLQLTPAQTPSATSQCLKIPVYYGEQTGPDLAILAEHANMSIPEVIQAHHAEPYFIYATGFLPGFAFLGFVPQALSMPRKAKPRAKVPKGSVGIAGRQTGVYPNESPGGWQIIGQTPLDLTPVTIGKGYALSLTARLKVGGYVQFYPISRSEFENWPPRAKEPA